MMTCYNVATCAKQPVQKVSSVQECTGISLQAQTISDVDPCFDPTRLMGHLHCQYCLSEDMMPALRAFSPYLWLYSHSWNSFWISDQGCWLCQVDPEFWGLCTSPARIFFLSDFVKFGSTSCCSVEVSSGPYHALTPTLFQVMLRFFWASARSFLCFQLWLKKPTIFLQTYSTLNSGIFHCILYREKIQKKKTKHHYYYC